MKLSELRQIIKEELEEIIGTEPMDVPGAPQMARPAAGWKVTSNWEAILNDKITKLKQAKASGEKVDKSEITKYENVKDKLTSVASKPYFNFGAISYSQEPLRSELEQMGVIEKADVKLTKQGEPFSYKEKPVSSGVRGRIPVDINVKLDVVLAALNKFKAGEDLTDNEKKIISRALNKNI